MTPKKFYNIGRRCPEVKDGDGNKPLLVCCTDVLENTVSWVVLVIKNTLFFIE
jgi:hypothetical protein